MRFEIVVTTVGSAEEARRIGRTLVDEGLCACAQIEAIESIYRWQGRTEQAPEHRLLLKAAPGRYKEIEARLRQLHPYSLPAIYALHPSAAWDPFAAWVQQPDRPSA